MTSDNDQFLARLLSTFRVEAGEHVQAITSGLLELEQAPDSAHRRSILAKIFREAHSLKGAARSVSLEGIESVCQAIESVFAAWKQADFAPTPDLLDPLHAALDTIGKMMPAGGHGAPLAAPPVNVAVLLNELATVAGRSPLRADQDQPPGGEDADNAEAAEDVLKDKPVRPAASALAARNVASALLDRSLPAAPETLRIAASKLDGLLLQAEELLAIKLTARQRAEDLRELTEMLNLWQKRWTQASELGAVAISAAADEAGNADVSGEPLSSRGEFHRWGQSHLRTLRERLDSLLKSANHDRRATSSMVDTLLEDCKKLLMLPFGTLLESFPKLVRDLSREQGKQVALVVSGSEIEIDKRILEEIKDPLVHLLRNAIDHGIEPPKERNTASKPARAELTVAVSQVDANKVEVIVADDGAGIDLDEVRATAINRGVLSGDDSAMTNEDELIGLIFRSDFSTRPIITNISGRGLGLTIVRERMEKLGGRVSVQTKVGRGTTFRLLVPVTLATFRGVVVNSGGQMFVLPIANVERVTRIRRDEVRTVESRNTVVLDDRTVSYVALDEVLGLARPVRREEPDMVPIVILGVGDAQVAFRVDAVLNEQEVLIKRLSKPLVRVRNVSGATVLGSGKAVPILNASDLLKSAAKLGGAAATPPAGEPEAPPARRSVLVVEDSITARMLLKNILEAAGYDAVTAINGVDGWTALNTGHFDLVVSDVEMPRMDGFELTARIRADHRWADLPVVLVTALASREDRERGVDVGANAYIVKSRFDQSDLLDVVKRLL